MDISLSPPSSPTPFKLVQPPSPSPLCRTLTKTTQLGKLYVVSTLSFSARNTTGVAEKPHPGFDDEEPNPGFDTTASRLQVQSFIDRIKASRPFKEASEIRKLFEKDGCFRKVSEFNGLLMALIIAEEFDIALSVFSEVSLSSRLVADWLTYCIMIRCYCGKNDLDEAKRVLLYMVEKGFYPNAATVTVLVNSLCKKGKLQRALEVLEVMGRVGCKPNVQIYNCLLKGLCYVGRVEDAYDMLMRIKKDDVKADIFTFTAVMDGFCKVGRSDEAKELLDEALEAGLVPDVVAYNTLFNGYCKEGRAMEGLNVLKEMKERNCMPDCISYSTLLHGLLKWGKTRNALRIYKEMEENGLEIDGRLMNNLVRGLCRRSWKEKDLLEHVYEVFERMKNRVVSVDASTHGLMIQTLCLEKKMDDAVVNLKQMIGTGYSPRIVTVNNVIQALCDEGKGLEALLVLGIMYEGSRETGRVSYNPLIHELNRQGRFLTACSVYGAALKRGVIPTKKPQQ